MTLLLKKEVTSARRKISFMPFRQGLKAALMLLLLGSLHVVSRAQAPIAQAASFTGAKAVKKHYYAVYQLNTSDDKIIKMTLRNIANALEDPRLKGKLSVELVAFADGWQVFNKDNSYGEALQNLQKKGVILAECHNTLRERNIPESQLLPFVSLVPSGNGELIIRQADGWSIVKP